ncbi:MAG: hypothetical protein H7X97_01875 [Opitutaceae bacterium]|nr:hypothetical protein [Verrucomicrobiales bacterium]
MVAILVGLAVFVGLYVFICYCLKLICEKAGESPGVLIWIPIVQLVPLLNVAKMPTWYIILFLIPIVNLIVGIIMWVKICQARNKPGWLVIMMFIPVVNIAFIPYLAFSE